MAERAGRRSFGPVVLAGLGGAGLAAMAGKEPWVTGRACSEAVGAAYTSADSPATTALALALLAAWGVLLATRGAVRRVAAVLGALIALGLVATVVLGLGAARDGCAGSHTTGWFWVAVVALPFAVPAAVAAARLAGTWPEMGRKYDAPTEAASAPATPPEEQENLDLWKAMDKGHDPTA